MIKNLFSKILSFFKNMQKNQRTKLIVLVSIVIIVIVFMTSFLNQKAYSVLYSGMDAEDAGEVFNMLSEMNVDAKPQGDDTILIADDQIDNVRMQLAAQGYPNSGINYDIFQNAAGLGVTDMDKQVYYQFQLQENLRQTIRKLDKVEDAVVIINLEKESSFVLSEDEKPATAAVMLMLKNNAKLNLEEVRAIAELVSKSVSGLQLDDVRIIDSKMNLYSIHDEDESANLGSQIELQQSVQSRLQEQVVNLLTPVFGGSNVLAEVFVSLDFDDVVTESVVFTPPVDGNEGIVVSMKELREVIKNDDTGTAAGIDSNGGASSYLASSDEDEDAVYYQTSREANYEINETKTLIENAKGQIEDLSVSVIINSAENWDDYTDSVKNLIANAVGVSMDSITVEMLPFKDMEQATEPMDSFVIQQQMLDTAQNASTLRLVITLAAALIVMIIIFSIFRMFKPKRSHAAAGVGEWDEGVDVLADEEIIPGAMDEEAINNEIDFDKKDNRIAVLEDYIDKNPESVANLLRNWLNED